MSIHIIHRVSFGRTTGWKWSNEQAKTQQDMTRDKMLKA